MSPKLTIDPVAGVPVGELDAAVGRQPAVVGHLGEADAPADGADAPVAGEHVFLVHVPQLAVDVPHRHRAIEDVEQLLLPGELGALIVGVAPDPGPADIIVERELIERNPPRLVERDVLLLAVAEVLRVIAARDAQRRIDVRSDRHQPLEEVELGQGPGRAVSFARADEHAEVAGGPHDLAPRLLVLLDRRGMVGMQAGGELHDGRVEIEELRAVVVDQPPGFLRPFGQEVLGTDAVPAREIAAGQESIGRDFSRAAGPRASPAAARPGTGCPSACLYMPATQPSCLMPSNSARSISCRP